jgi:hypothetical protein
MTTILGLDLGKFKSVSCTYRPATQEVRYETIDTDPTILWRGEPALEQSALEQIAVLLADAEAALDRAGQADERVRLLETVPGVGRRTAGVIAAYLDDPHRFRTAGEVSAYAGLVPRQFQSGQIDHHGRITERGPRLLRAVLVESSWLVVRYNPWSAAVRPAVARPEVAPQDGAGGGGPRAAGAVLGHVPHRPALAIRARAGRRLTTTIPPAMT